MTKADNAPTIGTLEAAVRSCVTLIASVTGQPEDLTERYLDLYYQVRRQAEETDCHTSAAALVRNDGDAEKETPVTVVPNDGPPRASAPTEKVGKPKNAPYGKIKAEIRDRFVALRAQGMTLAQTVNLSGNKVTENQILDIMNGTKVGMDAYNAIEDAMNKWEKTVKAADKTDSTTE